METTPYSFMNRAELSRPLRVVAVVSAVALGSLSLEGGLVGVQKLGEAEGPLPKEGCVAALETYQPLAPSAERFEVTKMGNGRKARLALFMRNKIIVRCQPLKDRGLEVTEYVCEISGRNYMERVKHSIKAPGGYEDFRRRQHITLREVAIDQSNTCNGVELDLFEGG